MYKRYEGNSIYPMEIPNTNESNAHVLLTIIFFLSRLQGVVRFPFFNSIFFDERVCALLVKSRSSSEQGSKYLVLLFFWSTWYLNIFFS